MKVMKVMATFLIPAAVLAIIGGIFGTNSDVGAGCMIGLGIGAVATFVQLLSSD